MADDFGADKKRVSLTGKNKELHMEHVKTLRLRIKDKHAKAMLALARDVNTVWNYCNETQYRSLRRYTNKPKVWLSGFDLQKLSNGFSKCEGVSIGSATQQFLKIYSNNRNNHE